MKDIQRVFGVENKGALPGERVLLSYPEMKVTGSFAVTRT
jgi:hypothetical protein